ncbi:MAG: DNA-deoxyinosine glycosylase [Eubacterium sp.]|nr:DNA-deoxyinosine glycosylase [Eubacterium sp.]
MLIHPIKPLYDSQSEILILGSFPSVKSREIGFFYGHPQNRFWKIMARICDETLPTTIEEKTNMILNNHFALWDVIHSCEISGSADSTIKNVTPNNLAEILNTANIKGIFVNGKKAETLYNNYIFKEKGIKAIVLPSTSPANASWSEDRLFEYWSNAINEARENSNG